MKGLFLISLNMLVMLAFLVPGLSLAIDISYSHRPLLVKPGTQLEPRVGGNSVVFTDLSAFLGDIYVINVYTYDTINITGTPTMNEQLNDIDDSLVVYTDLSGSGFGDVIVYNLNAPPESAIIYLLATPLPERRPRIGDGYVVYEFYNDDADIIALELATGTVIPVDTSAGNQKNAATAGGKIVYENEDDTTVIMYDIATASSTVLDTGISPDINEYYIVYEKAVSADNRDIFLYNIASGDPPIDISPRYGRQLRPTLYDNLVAYDDNSAGNLDIYMYVIKKEYTSQVTDDPADQYLSHIGDGYIVYNDNRNGDLDLYLSEYEVVYDVMCVAAIQPVNNQLNIDIATNIGVHFGSCGGIDQEYYDTSSVNDSTVLIFGNLTGKHPGIINYTTPSYISYNPNQNFAYGEEVTIICTQGIVTLDSIPLVFSFSSRFITEVNGGHGEFVIDTSYSVETQPYDVRAADLNNDGHIDIITANEGSNSISVLLNAGDGSFAPQVSYPVGGYPWTVYAADFDSDGDLDLTTANVDGISVLFNNGDGTFAPQDEYLFPGYADAAYPVDIEGDGDFDIAIANEDYQAIRIMYNDSQGNFDEDTSINLNRNLLYVCAADLDDDGDMDLVTANGDTDSCSIVLRNAYGEFQYLGTYPTGDLPSRLCIADLNGDKSADLVFANRLSDNISVMLNYHFNDQVLYSCGDQPQTVIAADLDGDGDLDLAVANRGSDDITILYNAGDGTFPSQMSFPAGTTSTALCAADFDGDGDLDLVEANYSSNSITILKNDISYVTGDANGDQTVNVSDAVYIINYVFAGGDAPDPLQSGDANCDDTVNISDAVYIINYVFAGGNPPGDPNGDGEPDC